MVRSGVGSRLRANAPFTLFVGGVLAYGAAFAWYLVGRFDLLNVIRDVNYDDAFYYFQIAWRMAQGEFSTYDGITRTNGYHPLWLFLITPFYWVFDKTEALFAIKAFEIVLVAGGVALVAGAARAARQPWVLLFAALPALYGQPALFLGLEAAAALFMLGLFLLAVCLFARDPARWRWPLAAVAFALPWVRLEYVAIALAVTAALWFFEWSGAVPGSAPLPLRDGGASRARRRGGWTGWWRSAFALRAAAPAAGAVAGILAYFAWNAVVFGGAVPVSAATHRWISQQTWEQAGGYRLAENVQGFLRSGHFDGELLIALEVCVYAVLVWWCSRRSRGREDWLLLAFLVGVSGLAAGHLAKFATSVLALHPARGSYPWQFAPAYLMEAIVVPVRCCAAIWFLRRAAGPGRLRASRIASPVVVTIGVVFLSATADFAAPFRFVDSEREKVVHEWSVYMYMGAMVMNRVLPEHSVVGTEGGGYIGYFSRFPVVNMDALVNSWDYLRARKAGTAAAFRQRFGITHRVSSLGPDHRRSTLLFEGPLFRRRVRLPYEGSPLQGTTDMRQFKMWPTGWRETSWSRRGGAGWFLERMEPHLERHAAGVGLLVDGRAAQAFVPDCPPDALAAWTWGGRAGDAARPWTRTSLGFCASAVVLPPGARPPVRVATMTVGEYLERRTGDRRPAIDSDYDVYVVGNRLVYVNEACGQEDVDMPFFLHVEAVDPGDLPFPGRRRGFDNLDFGFEEHGLAVGGACVAEVPLPEYGIAAVRTGQYVAVEGGFDEPWRGEIRLGPSAPAPPSGERLADRVRGRWPVVDADFDVYLVDGALVYVKEACGAEDVDAPFFLHVEAVDPDDLPGPRRRHGFDNLDFRFDERGARFEGACLAEAPLPEYGVAAFRTGQYVEMEGGFHRPWEGEVRFGAER